MLKIHPEDSERILENFKTNFEYNIERGRYKQAFRVTAVALRDLWISGHEYKWTVQKRAKLSMKIDRYNFENHVSNTIDKL